MGELIPNSCALAQANLPIAYAKATAQAFLGQRVFAEVERAAMPRPDVGAFSTKRTRAAVSGWEVDDFPRHNRRLHARRAAHLLLARFETEVEHTTEQKVAILRRPLLGMFRDGPV